MVTTRALLVAATVAVLLISVGCASERTINEGLALYETDRPPDATYIVDPPDALRIEFLAPEDQYLNRSVVLRQDGCITLLLLGDVKVSGLTSEEISRKLEELYQVYIRDPKILVTVTSYNSKKIRLYGEVGHKGDLAYTGTMTIADAIGAAGGVTSRAWKSRVKVIRGDTEDPEIYRVDLNKLIFEGDLKQNILLAEDDVIHVPPNPFAWVGYQLDNLLFPFRAILGAFSTGEGVTRAAERTF